MTSNRSPATSNLWTETLRSTLVCIITPRTCGSPTLGTTGFSFPTLVATARSSLWLGDSRAERSGRIRPLEGRSCYCSSRAAGSQMKCSRVPTTPTEPPPGSTDWPAGLVRVVLALIMTLNELFSFLPWTLLFVFTAGDVPRPEPHSPNICGSFHHKPSLLCVHHHHALHYKYKGHLVYLKIILKYPGIAWLLYRPLLSILLLSIGVGPHLIPLLKLWQRNRERSGSRP